jgi:hypothetical protein
VLDRIDAMSVTSYIWKNVNMLPANGFQQYLCVVLRLIFLSLTVAACGRLGFDFTKGDSATDSRQRDNDAAEIADASGFLR